MPRKSKVVFTLIFSIKKRSIPLNIKYVAKRSPAVENLVLSFQRMANRMTAIVVSYKEVG